MHKEVPWGEFCNTAGPTPRNRVLEFFIDMRDLDYTPSDIAEFTGLNRATTHKVMNRLEKEKYLMSSRKISGVQLYKVNKNKREVKLLIAIFDMILDKIAQEYDAEKHTGQKEEIIQPVRKL